MKLDLKNLEDHFSVKAFLYGSSGVVALYCLLLGYAAFSDKYSVEEIQDKLASQSVIIDYIKTTVPVATEPRISESAKLEQEPLAAEETDLDVFLLDKESNASKNALISAPVAGLYEETKFGKLPFVQTAGKTPFKIYKKPFLLNHDNPALAIAVLSYGLSPLLSEKILKDLPSSVSLVLTPYADEPEQWQKKARDKGHETWLQLMVEGNQFPKDDPGAMALMSRVSMKYNLDRLHWTLGRTTGYTGIAAFTDKTMENAAPMFTAIAMDIFKRGLGYLELNPDLYSFIEPLAVDENIPNVHNFIMLDDVSMGSENLVKIVNQVKQNAGAIVVVKPTPQNIEGLKIWIKSMQESGIQIVPVSALADLSMDKVNE